MADLDGAQHGRTGIEDVSTGYDLIVNANGSINTTISAPETPPAADEIIQTVFNDVATVSGTDSTYTITNAKTLHISQFTAGAEGETGGSVIELYDDPNGDGTGMTLIAAAIIDASTITIPISQDFDGDGTARILIRRRGYTASAREVFARWQGYEGIT